MFEFKLPDLGEGVHEGQVVNVLVKEGDTIDEYQPMLEVETDKAAVEIPAPKAGRVAKLNCQPGQMVKVGQVLVVIDDSATGGGPAAPASKPAESRVAESKPPAAPARAAAPPPAAPRPAAAPAAAPAVARTAPAPVVTAPEPARPAAVVRESNGPVPAAPAVRKLARELNVDINLVPGSGPGGRILREDVERFASAGGAVVVDTGAAPSLPAMPMAGAELPDFSTQGPVRRETPPQIRKTIARAMTRAWQNVPRVTHADRADITDLEQSRKAYNAALKEGETKLTVTAVLVKAVAAALRRYPMLNCSFDAASEEIIYKDYCHIGIAVDTPRGLVVPVLRDAATKPLPQIAAELADIASKARAAAFAVNDLRGATFTITNVGAIGGLFFTPMVNFPEVGILGVGRASLEPAVRDGQIVPRLLLSLSLSFDHRVCDGADAARFVTELIGALENPLRLLSLT